MLTASFICLNIISVFFLLRDKYPISLRQSFYVFCIIFLGIAAYIQIYEDYIVAPMYQDIRNEDYLKVNIIIILSILLYETTYTITQKYFTPETDNQTKTIIDHNKNSLYPILVCITLLHLYLNNFSISNIVLRGGNGNRLEINQTIGLLFNAIHFSFLSFFYYYSISEQHNKIVQHILFLYFFALCLPTAVSRLRLLPLYIPVIVIIYPKILQKRFLLSLSIIVGVFSLFPLLWATRLTIYDLTNYSFKQDEDIFSIFASMDFDTYKTLSYVISKDVITNGRQLLGCLFFWVPRTMWPTKPVGSGHYIAQAYDLGIGEFSNISMNYLGEGYINFGYIGIIVFVIALAVISAKADFAFWEVKKGDFKDSSSLIYLVSVGYIYFLLRGDMLSGLSYYIGIIVYILFVRLTCFSKQKKQLLTLSTQ